MVSSLARTERRKEIDFYQTIQRKNGASTIPPRYDMRGEIILATDMIGKEQFIRCYNCQEKGEIAPNVHGHVQPFSRFETPVLTLKHLANHILDGDKVDPAAFDIIHEWLADVGKDSFTR